MDPEINYDPNMDPDILLEDEPTRPTKPTRPTRQKEEAEEPIQTQWTTIAVVAAVVIGGIFYLYTNSKNTVAAPAPVAITTSAPVAPVAITTSAPALPAICEDLKPLIAKYTDWDTNKALEVANATTGCSDDYYEKGTIKGTFDIGPFGINSSECIGFEKEDLCVKELSTKREFNVEIAHGIYKRYAAKYTEPNGGFKAWK